MQAGRRVGVHAGRREVQAGRCIGMQAGRHVGRYAGRQAGM